MHGGASSSTLTALSIAARNPWLPWRWSVRDSCAVAGGRNARRAQSGERSGPGRHAHTDLDRPDLGPCPHCTGDQRETRPAADHSHESGAALERRIAALLGRMTLAEKIGQMNQLNAGDGVAAGPLREDIRAGRVGAVLNVVDPDVVNALQRVAVQESRLGIPLLAGRDVIHAFAPCCRSRSARPRRSIRHRSGRRQDRCARSSAAGVNWTFAPMIDIARTRAGGASPRASARTIPRERARRRDGPRASRERTSRSRAP